MKILIDILHPAHVHFFRLAIREWRTRGHEVVITVRDKDIARALLDRYGFAYTDLGAASRGLAAMALELPRRTAALWKLVRRERPAVLAGIAGVTIAPVGWLSGLPSVVFTDTENAVLSNRITFPFASTVCTPSCYEAPVRHPRHVQYAGYHELAYLHPKRFTPDPNAIRPFGVTPEEPYIVVRTVAWAAAHDTRDHGFVDLGSAVGRLQRYGRVLISAEGALPPALEPLRVTAAPEQIHHLLAYARLLFGESATMASEAAVLGTPAIFLSTSTRGYTNEQERRYGLTYTFSSREAGQPQALERAEAILRNLEARAEWRAKRERMLADKIDVTDFVVRTVEDHGVTASERKAPQ